MARGCRSGVFVPWRLSRVDAAARIVAGMVARSRCDNFDLSIERLEVSVILEMLLAIPDARFEVQP
jgi:hypothetical protein